MAITQQKKLFDKEKYTKEGYVTCSYCKEQIRKKDALKSGEEYYCKNNECSIECLICTEWFSRDYVDACFCYSDIENQSICEDCYCEHYTHCCECECEIGIDDAYGCNDGYLCEDCYDNRREESDLIEEAGYKPSPRFYHVSKNSYKKNRTLFFGVELEIDNGDYENNNGTASHILDNYKKLFYCKDDSSLRNGFEVVSHPFSWLWYKKNTDTFLELLDFVKKEGFESNRTNTCGIHIHLSKNQFTPWHYFKLLKFFFSNKKFILKLSQRSTVDLDAWATLREVDRPTTKRCIKTMAEQAKNKRQLTLNRNVAVNGYSSQTIELRIFKGNLNHIGFLKNIEFCQAIYMFTMFIKLKDLTNKKFKDYIKKNKKEYPNLWEFLNNNNQEYKD